MSNNDDDDHDGDDDDDDDDDDDGADKSYFWGQWRGLSPGSNESCNYSQRMSPGHH